MLRMRITENCVFFVFICRGCLLLLRCENVTHAHNEKNVCFVFLCVKVVCRYYGAKGVFIYQGCVLLLRCKMFLCVVMLRMRTTKRETNL